VGELTFLRRWKEEILTKIKPQGATTTGSAVAEPAGSDSRIAELRAQIKVAVVEERYEDAALLRDELQRLEKQNRDDE
jgi:protein-arginine kinase activator protein McsA